MRRALWAMAAVGLCACLGDPFLPAGGSGALDSGSGADVQDGAAEVADHDASDAGADVLDGADTPDLDLAGDGDGDGDAPTCPSEPLVVTASDGVGGPGTARFGEAVTITADLPEGVDFDWNVEPPGMSEFVTAADGEPSLTLQVTEVGIDFGTTAVTIGFSAETTPDCPAQTGATVVNVTGNVWAYQWSPTTVVAYRSDGSLIGQALPAGTDDNPDSLFQLDADHVATGGFYADTVRVFDRRAGTLITTFDETLPGPDGKDVDVYKGDGPRAVMRHATDGAIWVGGPLASLLVFEPSGAYVDTFTFSAMNMPLIDIESMAQLPGGDTIVVGSYWSNNQDWFVRRVGSDGQDLGPFASGELDFRVHYATVDWRGDAILCGRERFTGDFVVVRASPAGVVQDISEPTDAIDPKNGFDAFGRGFLVATNAGRLALVNEDLELVDPAFIAPAEDGKLKGFVVLEGP